ncbi:MAG: hypothetical protein HW387_1741 [Parachlamydiales bacterium]|nr:hypothetical protein [Parachlamydiales bacterium]
MQPRVIMKKNRLFLFLIVLFVVLISSNARLFEDLPKSKNILLTAPPKLSSKDIENLPKRIFMTWNHGAEFFQIEAHEGCASLKIHFEKLPDKFLEEIKSCFVKTTSGEGHASFEYCYHLDFFNDLQINTNPVSNKPSGYAITSPRFFEKSSPHVVSVAFLLSLIKKHYIAFYTGAGLSISSNVPSMSNLEEMIGINPKIGFNASMESILNSPENTTRNIYQFYRACFYSKPSKAHYAIYKLANFKKCPVFTENLDFLHEITGISPYRISPEIVSEHVLSPTDVKVLDYMICVGLSHDDRGFLNWYKSNNPKGKIIAIDFGVPTYLGDEDFIIQEDLQQVFEFLENGLQENGL